MKTWHVTYSYREDNDQDLADVFTYETFQCVAEDREHALEQCRNAYPDAEIGSATVVMFSVGVYLIDRAYGGPEEGGWWYDCGQLVDPTEPLLAPTYHTLSVDAVAKALQVNIELDKTLNKGRRPISSVLSEGQFAALVHVGHPPQNYPTTRPHYE
jgi:hypothetical protein